MAEENLSDVLLQAIGQLTRRAAEAVPPNAAQFAAAAKDLAEAHAWIMSPGQPH